MGLVWNAQLYDAKHAFVAQYGADLFEVLAAKPGERVLDVGCGTGDHVAELRARGVDAVGVDASPDMIARARAKYTDADLRVADARSLGFEGEFDAVVSNAALHWVHEADAAAQSIAAALKAGGRFVAELGGAGNVAILVAGVQASRAHIGLPPAPSPWYFPSVAQYAAVLEHAGLEVRQASLFDRPTKLEGDDGVANWVRMFGHAFLAGVADADADALLADVSQRLEPQLHRDGCWFADYRRLRIVAVKP
ncbi:methyltransferase domain-containing protein [Pendulispora brunnea]|uniref:Methyltransferase domain-containing protein n=1 Tax=Pendulispora brunnea TaxID=2905690 RepID=A0ABZ2JZ69_9BACT